MLNAMRRRRHPAAAAVVVFQLLAVLSLPARAQSLPAFDASRTITQQASVQQAIYALAAESSDSDADGYLEPPAMGAGAGPTGGGVIPSASGATKTDGYGVALGYCAWDNGSTASSANRINGGIGLNRVSMAVISAGLDNVFQTSCADLSAGTLRGDDYALWFTGTQLAQGIGGTLHWGAPVTDVATLNGISTTALTDGEIRLVKADNKLYRYTAGTGWASISGSGGSGAFSTSGSTLYYTAGQVGIGTNSPIAGSSLHVQGAGSPLYVQSTGQYSGMATLSAGGTQNGYLGFDNTNNQLLLNSIPAGSQIALAVNGSTRFTVDASGNVNLVTGGLQVGGTTVIDASRNLSNIANITASGSAAITGAANVGSLQIAGTTVIDGSRNLTNIANITASGTANVGSLQIGGTGVIDASRNISNIGTLTAGGLITANNGLAVNLGTANAPAITFGGVNTGFFSPAAGQVAVSTGGTERLRVNGAGRLLIGGTSDDGANLLQVSGGIGVGGSNVIDSSGNWVGGAMGPTKGGTGITSYAQGDLLYASAANTLARLAKGTAGQVLTMNGGATAPLWADLAATNASNLSGGALGSLPYQSAAGTTAFLAGNATTTKMFLSQTGTGAASAAPAWAALAKGDVGLGNVENTALSAWTGSTNIATLGTVTAGTWNGTAIGPTYGGTGLATFAQGDILYASAANTLARLAKGTAGQVLTMNPGATAPVWADVSASSATNLSGGALGSLPYQSAAGTTAFLAGNTTTTKMFLSQTGTGAASAAPAWGALVAADIPNLDWSKITSGKPTTISGYGITDGVTLTGTQTLQNKTLDNTNAITVKSTSFTLQDAATTTKQAQFVLSGITAGQTRSFTLPDYNGTLATLAGTETLTNKTLGAGSTWNGNAIGATYGGTGLTAYAQGDVLYASAANTLAALPKGTAGQVLTMNAGATAPVWATPAAGGSVDWANPGTIGSTTPNSGSFTWVNVTSTTKPVNGMYLQAANSLGFSTNSTERVRITAAGILCVNCATGIPSGSNNPYYVTVNGNILGTRFDGSSDARLKTNVITVSNALAKVRALRGVGFDWRTDIPEKKLPGGHDLGFIAQELETVLPELVRTDAWGYRTVNYSGVIPVAIEAIKELDATVSRHDSIFRHFSKPDANTMVLDIPVLKAANLLAEELGVKKISTPVIEITDSFRIRDKVSQATRFEIDSTGKVILDTLAVAKDLTIGGSSTVAGTQTAGAFIPTSAGVPVRGLFAPNTRSIGFAADSKLVAELEARGFAVYGDIYVGEAGAVKKVIDKDGYIYAANEVASGNPCAGKAGAIGRDAEGNLYVCR